MRETGVYQQSGTAQYFIPHALPPANPPLQFSPEIIKILNQATLALSELNEVSKRIPSQRRFIKSYVIKEALLSSAIEGVHTTLIDVFTHPVENTKPNKKTQLVLNYTLALEEAVRLMQTEGLPLASRVIVAAHEVLMTLGDGDKSAPGMFRKQSVSVGNLVPPPAPAIPQLISQLEKYINEPSELAALIRIGLVHLQFETIHPFLDGNGRIGRLLIVLMLMQEKLLSVPVLYPSYYFKKHHLSYYMHLDRVRTHGDFEGWITFFLQAMYESTTDALLRAQEIDALDQRLRDMITSTEHFARGQATALDALACLFEQPVVGVAGLQQALTCSYNTASRVIQKLITIGLLTENPGRGKRNRLYQFTPYLELLEKELQVIV